ncbi:MFS transporter [Agromyces neolithicus]|uniref:Major facilitator superfamily (MFS) profile domain-containing protein n=1 Tax=Agromyces neolithicus TaxID=269420 RepID=A0ABN2LSU6_9MICO
MPGTTRRLWPMLTCLMVVMLLGAIDQTASAPALPLIAQEFGGVHLMPLVVVAYLGAATAAMPAYGKLGDRFGRRPVLLTAIVLFAAGAVVAATAASLPIFVGARIVQGLGGGGLMLSAQAIIGEIVSPRERGRYLGWIGIVYVIAAVGGPLIGGVVIQTVGWRWIFVGYLPLAVVAFVLAVRTLRLPRPSEKRPLDIVGAVSVAVLIAAVVVLASVVERGQPWPAITALIGVIALAATTWIITALRATDPVIPLGLFRDPAFSVPVAVSLLIGVALFGTISFLPAVVQLGLGVSPVIAGSTVTVAMAGVIVTMTVSGRMIARTGRYRVYPVVGTATAAVGLGLLGLLRADTPLWAAALVLLMIGAGIGLVMQVMLLAAQNAVAHANLGVATSTVVFIRQVGATIGVAVTGALINVRSEAAAPGEYLDAVAPVFGYGSIVLVLAFALTLMLPERPLRTTAHRGTEESDEPEEPGKPRASGERASSRDREGEWTA